jgi:hypothetical protein
LIDPPRFSEDELKRDLTVAIEEFRSNRLQEPLEDYLEAFDEYLGATEELLETSVDLTALESQALNILTNKSLLDALRYTAGPPISIDDLKTVSEVPSFDPKRLKADPTAVRRVIETIQIGLDRKRFPWIIEEREPTEIERKAAVLASAALMASSKVGTKRRSTSKVEQEGKVEAALIAINLHKAETRAIKNMTDAPAPGEFCRECMLGSRKADFVARVFDGRILAVECKVSNSATNSIKRVNNDAAVKAEVWIDEFGTTGVVPSAVLSGVYKMSILETAQRRGLTIFWAHDLSLLTNWIQKTH